MTEESSPRKKVDSWRRPPHQHGLSSRWTEVGGLTHDDPGVIPRLRIIAPRDAALAHEGVDEGVDDGRAEGLDPHYEDDEPVFAGEGGGVRG